MTEALAKIALLFDDAELVGQLRAALQERDAQIVHEGSLAQFNRAVLEQSGAEVLVVNLDDDDVDALDRLHEMIDGDRLRLVFNDAQASRGLHGWDRARWARHLAVKALARGDLDPPRPLDAPVFDAVVAAPAPTSTPAEPAATAEAASEPVAAPLDDARLKQVEAESASLAAELEALLAADRFQVGNAEDFGEGLKLDIGDELSALHDDFIEAAGSPPSAASDKPDGSIAENFNLDHLSLADFDEGLKPGAGGELPLYDGNFAEAAGSHTPPPLPKKIDGLATDTFDLDHLNLADDFGAGLELDAGDELPPLYDGNFAEGAGSSTPPPLPRTPDAPSAATFNLDHLSLLPLDELPSSPQVASDIQLDATPANLILGPSASWSLVDDDAPPASAEAAAPVPAVEKLSAAEYLAPQVETQGAPPLEPGLSLQLVSQEEAVAPQSYQAPNEMQLDDLGNSALRQVAVLGAAADSEEAVCSFLAALPARLRLPVLLAQHLGGQPIDELILRLALHSPWPVKLAAPGVRARIGEVLVIPPGAPLRLLRDGQLERQGSASGEQADARPATDVSIDAAMSAIAQVFGRDARAIVFAGRTNDALGGAQAIHARGGQVWVEQSARGHYANMVDAILAERLVSFSGTPPELAARLGEENSMDRYSTESGR